MKGNMEERAERLAQYIIENRTTVRAAAQKFGISKSTVHKDISERLPQFNRVLYQQVKEVLEVPLGPVRKTRTGPFSSKDRRGSLPSAPVRAYPFFSPHRMEQQEAGSVVF